MSFKCRTLFGDLVSQVERLRQEKTKYLSVIGSIIGALIGIIGSSINNAMKMKEFKNIVLSSIQAQQLSSSGYMAEGIGKSSNNSVLAQSSEELGEIEKKRQILEEQHAKLGEEIRKRDQELSNLIHETGSNLEYKMKINALATVAVIYASIAVTIPLLIKFFGAE